MSKDLNILVLNSDALKLSIDDLTNEIDVPVKWDIVDLSDKEKIRKIDKNDAKVVQEWSKFEMNFLKILFSSPLEKYNHW